MRTIRRVVFAAVISATPLCFAPSLAAAMHHNMIGGLTCDAAGTTDAGMMIEFHNMGKTDILAGSKAHWRLSGVAQGDVHFQDAVAPGAMKSQTYAAAGMAHMPRNARCTVMMTQ